MLSVDHRVFGGLCHDLPLQLLDVFREIGTKLLNIVDLRDQAQLHLVDRVVDGLELLLIHATALLTARGRARSHFRWVRACWSGDGDSDRLSHDCGCASSGMRHRGGIVVDPIDLLRHLLLVVLDLINLDQYRMFHQFELIA